MSTQTDADPAPAAAGAPFDVPQRRADARAHDLFDAAPDATVGVDAQGRIELVNAQAVRLFGWSAQELIGQQVEVLVPLDLAGEHVRHRAEYAADPDVRPMCAGVQLAARRKDGSTFPAEISLSPVTDELGRSLVLASVLDVSSRIEQENDRQRHAFEVQRLESLGQLAGGVAHDFNNLLGVILNYTTLVSRRVTDPVLVADLGEIRAAAERGAALTRQLLTFARRDQANPEALDLNGVVRSVASMLERTLGEHIVLNLALGDEPVVAVCDRTQLEQILLNLAINARDAMSDGGVLRIAASTSPPSSYGMPHAAVLTVTDTGHGMSTEVIERAFEPFFSTKPRGRGTGLGLATVYGIVKQNGGKVGIDSAPGRGTTMTVRLLGARRLSAPQAAHQLSAIGGNERILLVEDKEQLRIVTARMLTDRGYHVLTACDGVDAIEVLDREGDEIDIVVTDVAMPRMRGDELAEQLRQRPSKIPMIFMTGYDSGAAPLTGRVLAKPVAEGELLLAIREALDV